jgi:site-specific DNA-methyltransferase (adenine-specific)
VKIGNLPKDVRDAIRGTPVEDSQTDLLKLARMEAVERRRVATRIANGAKSIKDAKREEHREAKSPSKDHCAKAERDWRLVHSECGALRKKHVADESVDCIITDPPYPREFLNCYSDLGRLAADVLNPGGSCIVMCGQSYLPDVLRRLCEHLEYQWAIAYLTPGGQSAQLWDRKVNTFWKPLLWLIKPPRPSSEWYGDVLSSDSNDNDKRFRDWGQSESGMAAIVNRFTMPGATVLDPFVGGGTTGVVAVKLGRIFIGSDSDVDQITRTRIRLESVG